MGETADLWAKGVYFGKLTRHVEATWDTSTIEGLSRMSIAAPTPLDGPSLIIRPWHQVGNVVSLREFTNNAYNRHHGIQTTERYGWDTDLDGDGLTRADVAPASLYQAAMAVPVRVMPRDPDIEMAVLTGEKVCSKIHCARCHVPALPLDNPGWIYTNPTLMTHRQISDRVKQKQ